MKKREKPRNFSNKYWLVIFAFCAQLACDGFHSRPAPEQPKRAVIFVPGYKGSVLEDPAQDKVVWISLSEILWGKRSLALGAAELTQPLVATRVLDSVPLCWGLFHYNVYGDFLNALRKGSGSDSLVTSFYYDWRQDIRAAARALAEKISELRLAGVEQIDVIGHSMGGLVLAYYLLHETAHGGAQQIHRAVFVAAPFLGSVRAVRDFQRGNKIGPNRDLLNRDALATFPALFELLPSADSDSLVDEHGMPVALFDPAVWKSFDLKPAGDADFAQKLRNAKEFHDELGGAISPGTPALPPILNIQASGYQTESACYVSAKFPFRVACTQEELREAHAELPSARLTTDGDGVVTLASSALPDNFKSGAATTNKILKAKHEEILDEPLAQKAIFRFVFTESSE